jgi:hypothetical protein
MHFCPLNVCPDKPAVVLHIFKWTVFIKNRKCHLCEAGTAFLHTSVWKSCSLFSSEIIITIIIKFAYIRVHSLQSWDHFSSLHDHPHFSTFASNAGCRRRKLLCWRVGTLHAHCLSSSKMASLECTLHGTKKWKLKDAKSRLYRGCGWTNSRCRLIQVKSWLASSATGKESC